MMVSMVDRWNNSFVWRASLFMSSVFRCFSLMPRLCFWTPSFLVVNRVGGRTDAFGGKQCKNVCTPIPPLKNVGTRNCSQAGISKVPWTQWDGDAFHCVADGHEVLCDGLRRRRQGMRASRRWLEENSAEWLRKERWSPFRLGEGIVREASEHTATHAHARTQDQAQGDTSETPLRDALTDPTLRSPPQPTNLLTPTTHARPHTSPPPTPYQTKFSTTHSHATAHTNARTYTRVYTYFSLPLLRSPQPPPHMVRARKGRHATPPPPPGRDARLDEGVARCDFLRSGHQLLNRRGDPLTN